jgi:large subunit ribosomal protein L23
MYRKCINSITRERYSIMMKKITRMFQNRNNPTFCDVIKKTILTEKSTQKLEKEAVYMFEVQNWANKIIVRHAIAQIFSVRVLKVNIMNTPGKEKRRKSGFYKTAIRKIAIVNIHPDDFILLERN